MDFWTAVKTCFNKYATFRGRATRPEYWWFVLFLFIANIVLSVLDFALFGMHAQSMQPISTIFSLVTILPSLAAAVRRLHDTGRSGWWLLLIFIPILGFLVLIWFLAQPSEEGENDFGPAPGEAGAGTSIPRVNRQ
ncbi:DUF805 domain-containing protein [Defluviimonas sp. WL0002]|uniref:DUF805 domain-containing protein n=1 Tax=Albidovulum marisflavi TaxID=2984159 RepID=A0ABT2Z833_9RHOB|nr:DUF805 domain-containing protein [Defluviimonas sp. WL0002]MCV2867187.1 DUF805 domain-containing protein [Defluviimonas sp. WL0002]